MLKLYHAEPAANSLKCLMPLMEKGQGFESVSADLHCFEQHEPWFVALSPDGQVPVLDHDGTIVTQSSVSNEYREDVFPETPRLRPAGGAAIARMRTWNRFIGVLARGIEAGEDYTLADINFHAHCGMFVARLFPDLSDDARHPRLADGRGRVAARPATVAALARPDHTNPAPRTFTGGVH